MNSIADSVVIIQTTSRSVPWTPSWFGEVALIVEHLRKQGVLSAIGERVRFARRRFGHYEVIDCVAVLFGSAISGERTLETFYDRLAPFAIPFMALFGRHHLPARSTLSRFLAALTKPAIEALRTLFLEDGTGATLADLAGFSFVVRGKDYTVLDRPEVQAQRAPACRSAVQPPRK